MIIWRYGLILPLAGGISLGLAMIMKASVSLAFVPHIAEHSSTSDKAVNSGDSRVDSHMRQTPTHSPAPLVAVSRDLYKSELLPERLEPDKNCHLYDQKPKRGQIFDSVPMGYLMFYEPERAKAIETARKKAAEEKSKDPCPLIVKPTPTLHNPVQTHIPVLSL